MAGTAEGDFDFSDMLGLEAGAEIKIVQDGQEIKPEEPKAEVKPAQASAPKPAAAGNKKGAKGKKVDVEAEEDEEELTEEQRRQKVLDGDALNAAALMGIDIKSSIEDIPLGKEVDYANFASIIHLKLKTANPKKPHLLAFANDLLKHISELLGSDELDKIEKRVKILFNDKLKEEKGATNNKKKTTTAKQVKVEKSSNLKSAYQDYEEEGMEGTNEYGGYNDVDFM